MKTIWNLALLASLAFSTCSFSHAQEKEAAKQGASQTLKLADGKLTLVTPDTWKSVPTKSNFIDYEFRAPAEGESFARITFSLSGGTIKQNIERWVGQFDKPAKEDVKTEEKEIGKAKAHFVDIKGTFKDSMGGGPFAPGPVKKMEGYRMIGAIIELPDGTKAFVKATGPADVLEKNKEAIQKMVDELQLSDAK